MSPIYLYIDKNHLLGLIDMHYYDALALRAKSQNTRAGIRLLKQAYDAPAIEFKKERFVHIVAEYRGEYEALKRILKKHYIYYCEER